MLSDQDKDKLISDASYQIGRILVDLELAGVEVERITAVRRGYANWTVDIYPMPSH